MSVIPVDQTIPVLDGRHELTVLRLSLDPESFSLDYVLRPPLPGDAPGDPEMVYLRIEATDDQGGTYDDYGGARGRSEDGTRTEGRITGQPALPPTARQVQVRFVFMRPDQETGYELTVPLSADSSGQPNVSL